MAVMVGKDDELLFLFEELAIGELNSYNQFLPQRGNPAENIELGREMW